LHQYQLVQLRQLCSESDELARFIPVLEVLAAQARLIRQKRPNLCPIYQLHRQLCSKVSVPTETEFFVALLQLSILKFNVFIDSRCYELGVDSWPEHTYIPKVEVIENEQHEASMQRYVNWIMDVIYTSNQATEKPNHQSTQISTSWLN
jgi:hypothetical protein